VDGSRRKRGDLGGRKEGVIRESEMSDNEFLDGKSNNSKRILRDLGMGVGKKVLEREVGTETADCTRVFPSTSLEHWGG